MKVKDVFPHLQRHEDGVRELKHQVRELAKRLEAIESKPDVELYPSIWRNRFASHAIRLNELERRIRALESKPAFTITGTPLTQEHRTEAKPLTMPLTHLEITESNAMDRCDEGACQEKHRWMLYRNGLYVKALCNRHTATSLFSEAINLPWRL